MNVATQAIADSQRAGSSSIPAGAAERASRAPSEKPSRAHRATLGQQLVGADIITPEQLDQALAAGSQKGLRLGEVLVETIALGHVTSPHQLHRDAMIAGKRSRPFHQPRIDLATHNPRYLCWQCHYPHDPKAQ